MHWSVSMSQSPEQHVTSTPPMHVPLRTVSPCGMQHTVPNAPWLMHIAGEVQWVTAWHGQRSPRFVAALQFVACAPAEWALRVRMIGTLAAVTAPRRMKSLRSSSARPA
jgi:hypothetical protein